MGDITVTFSIDEIKLLQPMNFQYIDICLERDRGFKFGNFGTDGISWENFVDFFGDYVEDLESGKNPSLRLFGMVYHHHGHAVVPYAIEYLPDGRALIRVYDPNNPFDYKEESDGNSSIYVGLSKDNSWTFFMGYEKEGNETKK